MSHFTVAVFHKNNQSVDDLLAPYYEGLEVEPYIWKTREEAIEYAKQWYPDYCKDKSDEECWKMLAEDSKTDEEGNIYSTYNPDSKWDWYSFGGRWAGLLKTKEGDRVDSDLMENLDFSPDEKKYQEALDFWESYVVRGETKEGGFYFYKREFYQDRYRDAETYAKCMAAFTTRAVVLPDGSWHEAGQMGWFGVSSESHDEALDWALHYKERFLDTAEPDWYITIVDCHI